MHMKKIHFTILLLSACLMCACGPSDKEAVKQYLTDLQQAISTGNTSVINSLYPTAAVADSLNASFSPELAQITLTQGDTLQVRLTEKMDITLVRDKGGKMTAIQSHGLFSYDPEQLLFALGTGQYKPSLDDGANAARMADTAFVESIMQQLYSDINSKVSMKLLSSYNYEQMTAHYTVVVSNNSDFDLDGEDYVATVRRMGFNFDTYSDVAVGSKSFSGQPLPAHGSVTYSAGTVDAEYESFKSGGVSIKSLSPEALKRLYTPTGNEYDEYLQSRQQ